MYSLIDICESLLTGYIDEVKSEYHKKIISSSRMIKMLSCP